MPKPVSKLQVAEIARREMNPIIHVFPISVVVRSMTTDSNAVLIKRLLLVPPVPTPQKTKINPKLSRWSLYPYP